MRAGSVALLLVLCACSTARGPVEGSDVAAQLGFLNRPAVTRAQVEARLGEAPTRYEKDSVVSYPVYVERDGRLTTTAPDRGRAGYTLMLEYATDGHVLRRALLRYAEKH